MSISRNEVNAVFGNRLRVRACGICIREEKVLLVKHAPLGEKGFLWAPPGGGMSFEETAEACVIRELKEETGLEVKVEKLLFVHEYMNPPLHALELFFLTRIHGGEFKLGKDPEIPGNKQMLQQIRFFSFEEINQMDKENLHSVFSLISSLPELLQLTGYIR